MRYYPVFLDLTGQLCIVLGDGKFATEKAGALREAGGDVQVISSRDYRPGALAGARLVVDASEDPEINRLSWEEAEAAGILINVVDRPAQCRFIAPAIVRRDPLLIAISTSGESPYLASALRARLERWLGREWGAFVARGGNGGVSGGWSETCGGSSAHEACPFLTRRASTAGSPTPTFGT